MRELKFRAWTHQNPPMQWFSKNVAITGDGKQMIANELKERKIK